MGAIQTERHHPTRGLGKKGADQMASKIDDLFTSSRFVLPEHRELYLEMQEEQKLAPRPEIEEDELAEMNFRIYDSVQYDYAITDFLKNRWYLCFYLRCCSNNVINRSRTGDTFLNRRSMAID